MISLRVSVTILEISIRIKIDTNTTNATIGCMVADNISTWSVGLVVFNGAGNLTRAKVEI